MRLAFVTSSSPLDLVWPRLADEQMVLGCRQPDHEFAGRVFSRRLPAGDCDLAAEVQALAANQRPEVIACVVDGRTRDWPRNVAATGAINVLLVGDTEASPGGLARILDYATRERFDRIILTSTGVDEGIFRAVVGEHVYWFPGLLSAVRDDTLPLLRQADRDLCVYAPPIENHGRMALRALLGAQAQQKNPLTVWSHGREDRLEEFGDGLVALVASEHAEWRAELFEALAAGAVVVATGLAPSDGARLWGQGAPMVLARDAAEAALKVRDLLAEPAAAESLRRAAIQWYDGFLGESPRRAAFWRILGEGIAPVAVAPQCAASVGELSTVARQIGALQVALDLAELPAWWSGNLPENVSQLFLDRLPRLRRQETSLDAHAGYVSGVDAPSTAPVVLLGAGAELPNGYEPAEQGAEAAIASDLVARRRAVAELWQTWESGDATRLLEQSKAIMARFPGEVSGVLGILEVLIEAGSTQGLDRCIAIATKLGAGDPRVSAMLERQRAGVKRLTGNRARFACELYASGETAKAAEVMAALAEKKITTAAALTLTALIAEEGKDFEAAAAAWARAARHHPNDDRLWFLAGITAARAGQRTESGRALRRAADHAPSETEFQWAFAQALAADPQLALHASRERNLVVTSSENCQKHGAGVLVKRFFGSHLDAISLRPATYYDGVEEAGAVHLCVPFKELPARRLQTRLRRLLAPYQVKRIMCIPFHREECLYALAAHEITGAKLCVYVMDDRNVLIPDTDDALMSDLFARASLRLAISSELQMAYTIKYDHDFEVMPPIVPDRAARRKNVWTPKVRPMTHVALVGSIWTDLQLRQMLRFVVRAGLKVDWFGRQASQDLSVAGVNAMGFVSERELADRLVEYPLVLVPSGTLDGTENNEWLTRLSLPSRIVFLLQTQTPVLVLGSKDTCASRHVLHLGIGRVIPYDHPQPQKVIAEMADAPLRPAMLAAAEAAADGFVMPEAGKWIWDSTDAGRAKPAPFHEFMDCVPEISIVWPPSEAGPIRVSHFA